MNLSGRMPQKLSGKKKYLDVYIAKDDIHYLKSIGMNSIRIPFNYRLFTNENYMGSNDATRGFTYLDRVIGWCKAEGLYVILDMHCAPGGQTAITLMMAMDTLFFLKVRKAGRFAPPSGRRLLHIIKRDGDTWLRSAE